MMVGGGGGIRASSLSIEADNRLRASKICSKGFDVEVFISSWTRVTLFTSFFFFYNNGWSDSALIPIDVNDVKWEQEKIILSLNCL